MNPVKSRKRYLSSIAIRSAKRRCKVALRGQETRRLLHRKVEVVSERALLARVFRHECLSRMSSTALEWPGAARERFRRTSRAHNVALWEIEDEGLFGRGDEDGDGGREDRTMGG